MTLSSDTAWKKKNLILWTCYKELVNPHTRRALKNRTLKTIT